MLADDLVERLLRDRQALLERLGLTEHEWACAGGERFSDVWAARTRALPPLPSVLPPLPSALPPLPRSLAALPPLPTAAPPLPVPTAAPPPPVFDAAVFDVMIAPVVARPTFEWTVEQRAALDAFDAWRASKQSFLALTGPAGTGKTTLLREICERAGFAALAAMTGKAAQRMGQLTGRPATTLHKILYYPPKPGDDTRFTVLRDPPSGLVIVDEGSMTSPSVFEDLQAWASDGTQILFVGDPYQLPPVITDAKERDRYGEDYSVFAEVSGPQLTQVLRNAGGVLEAATHVRTTGEVCRQTILDADGGGYVYERSGNALAAAVDEYCADPDDHLLITWRNIARMAANRAIRERLGRSGPLPDPGEPILVRKNGQGLLNGDIIECEGFEEGPKLDTLPTLWMILRGGDRVLVSVAGGRDGEFFDGGTPWVDNWSKYHIDLRRGPWPEPVSITWGYCLTAHSAQGSQARRTTVFLERGDASSTHFRKPMKLPSGETVTAAARWIYTATTRSIKHTKVIVGR